MAVAVQQGGLCHGRQMVRDRAGMWGSCCPQPAWARVRGEPAAATATPPSSDVNYQVDGLHQPER